MAEAHIAHVISDKASHLQARRPQTLPPTHEEDSRPPHGHGLLLGPGHAFLPCLDVGAKIIVYQHFGIWEGEVRAGDYTGGMGRDLYWCTRIFRSVSLLSENFAWLFERSFLDMAA